MRNVVLALFAALGLSTAPARADLLAAMNQIRAQGCGKEGGSVAPLERSPALDRVAESLMSGRTLRDAIGGAGYRAMQSATFEASGSNAAIALALAQRGCRDVIDPIYREAGIAERPNRAWIVLAVPFAPPAARDAGSVSQRVLALVNEARAQPRRCGWRRFKAAPPLALSGTLQRAASAHARDMAARQKMSHSGSNGSTPAERATRAGYRWRFVGENIAAGQPTPEAVVAEWLESPQHCANLMDADYTEMGVAFVTAKEGTAGIYWAQVFGAPSG
jgi:uncharacterized protein YkwD